jgi:hypothetical protein
MKWHETLGAGANLKRTPSRVKRNLLARCVAVSLKKKQRSRGHESIPAANGFRPIGETEFLLSDIRVSPICAERHVRSHLVSPSHGWQPVPAIEVSVPIEKAQEVKVSRLTALRLLWPLLWPELHSINLPERHVSGDFARRVRKMDGDGQPACGAAGV